MGLLHKTHPVNVSTEVMGLEREKDLSFFSFSNEFEPPSILEQGLKEKNQQDSLIKASVSLGVPANLKSKRVPQFPLP